MMLDKYLCLFLVICGIASVSGFGSLLNVTVVGQLGCGDRSVPNVRVELWERDRFDPDDLLNGTTSDRTGHFHIYGQQHEVIAIEPYIRITHHCNDGVLDPRCEVVDNYKIPKEYVGRVYDMAIVSLNIAAKKHKKVCED